MNPRTSWTDDGKRRLHRSNKVDHLLLYTSNTSADLLGIHLGLVGHPDPTPSPGCRLAHTARHHREEGTILTGETMGPVMVHPIIICRPKETKAGTAGNRVDRLSRAQVIHNRLPYLLDCLNVPILLDTPTDVDQVRTVLHLPCTLNPLRMVNPQRGRRRVGHLRLLLGS